MTEQRRFTVSTALIVALGGFLMGFDASVISGVVGFIEVEFSLSKIELGWSVASLAFMATFAMLGAGPLSDRLGRKPVLQLAALMFALSAVWSALAGSFIELVIARMVGGLGVGAALIIAPMYIAELSPPALRGRMVSLNQLNIVVGISVAFFSNYLILQLGASTADWAAALNFDVWNWRWMLGLEALPAVLYLLLLLKVPESPRWLIMRNRDGEALTTLRRAYGTKQADAQLATIRENIALNSQAEGHQQPLGYLFRKPMRLVLLIGVSVAVLQQITGINSVFFYAPMIFEQSGIGTDAAFMQAILVGLTNLIFTLVAMALIDSFGRRPILLTGVAGIVFFMFLLAWAFNSATYSLTADTITQLSAGIDRFALQSLQGVTFHSDIEFKSALAAAMSTEQVQRHESELIAAAINMNPQLILFGILGFVASFAVSLGPVMWVLFSELFPNRVRAIAISFVGFINSGVSFLVQLLFPWQLANVGIAGTFFIYGVFAIIGWLIIARLLPETRGKSLEEIEQQLVAPTGGTK
jgi:SP family arabinose:H+ symporter-like MFS transporter|tara:strand:+ start:1305 stop:2888 length:1584 start_codon:yes stop_codon:yes gene_type:complete